MLDSHKRIFRFHPSFSQIILEKPALSFGNTNHVFINCYNCLLISENSVWRFDLELFWLTWRSFEFYLNVSIGFASKEDLWIIVLLVCGYTLIEELEIHRFLFIWRLHWLFCWRSKTENIGQPFLWSLTSDAKDYFWTVSLEYIMYSLRACLNWTKLLEQQIVSLSFLRFFPKIAPYLNEEAMDFIRSV